MYLCMDAWGLRTDLCRRQQFKSQQEILLARSIPPSPLTKLEPTNGVVNTPIADRRSRNELSGRSVPLTQGGNKVVSPQGHEKDTKRQQIWHTRQGSDSNFVVFTGEDELWKCTVRAREILRNIYIRTAAPRRVLEPVTVALFASAYCSHDATNCKGWRPSSSSPADSPEAALRPSAAAIVPGSTIHTY